MTEMIIFPRHLCSFFAPMLFCFAGVAVGAAQPAASSVLPLTEVSAIVGVPVVVSEPSSFSPTAKGDTTVSNCTYLGQSANIRNAKLTLMWASTAKLAETNEYYIKRHKEASAIKGDVLVLAAVMDVAKSGTTYDRAASEKLLAAALQKLP